MKELAPAVPPILRELAGIRHFNVFVTTTFDSLLAQALNEERFDGEARTVSLAYSPNSNANLTLDARQSETPTVFHLLGKMSASPDYVITEEDTLEFFTAIQSESKRPNVLLDEMKTSHLLLIGNTFPDWLARFFIRIAKHGRLSLQRAELEIIADRSVASDPKLVLFLRNFSYRTQIFQQGSATDFVHELAARYAANHTAAAATAAEVGPDRRAGLAAAPAATVEMKPGSIFLSYASQDATAVKKIRDALEAV
ncbi:MAG: toll/interleukin-1 receptor domain-containing protein, partial [Opitutus sp.]|nr:toll/interleukin-1 receptor domain-containing protein [Opitutus sp.]